MGKVINIVTNVLGWLTVNLAKIVGIVEALAKLASGVLSFMPTKKRDALTPKVDKVFSKIKEVLYKVSEYLEKRGK